MAELQADAGQIEAFVSALFRYADPDTFVSLRAFDQNRRGTPPVLIRGIRAHPLEEVAREATRAANDAASRKEPAVFAPPICTLNNPTQARGVDLANGLALSVELDDVDPEAASARLEGIIGRATVVVYSGSDWFDPSTGEVKPKVHLHWRLSEPTQDTEEHIKLRRARELATLLVGGDPTAKPIVHPLRWPGSWNCKTAPRMATIAAHNDAAEINLAEALDALESVVEAEGWAKAEMPRPNASGAKSTASIADLRSAMAAIPNLGVEVHYDTWVRLGYALWRATGGADEGFEIWDQWSKVSDKYDAGETEGTWKRICAAMSGATPPVTIGAGTIFYMASQHGWIRLHPFFEKARNAFSGDEGDDPDAPGRRQRKPKPAILSLAELDALPPPQWLVDGIIPERGFVVPYGPPKNGKTFICLSWGLHIAAGRDWFGRKVKQGAVIYVAGEGTGGLSLRLRAMRQRYNIPTDIPFWVVPRAVNFRNDSDVAALAKLIRDTAGDVPVAATFLDTLARSMPGADENSAQEVGIVIAACDWLGEELECVVMPIHHSGKDEGKGARGTSALRGAWDAAFEIKKRGNGLTMKVTDQKEAEDGLVLDFDMEEVFVGIGRKSLVPILRETPPEKEDRKEHNLTGDYALAYQTLSHVIGGPDGGILPPLPDLPPDVRGVRAEVFRRAFYERMVEKTPEAKKKTYQRVVHFLRERRLIGTKEPWIWLV